ncbi:MAG TPA: N-acetylmuramoyl-L-alanine amidase [Kofleriaceae bacterium]|nr:N-acetylmuramoyl-L-alanine amidase [Kofleriaceae bacterium]
MVRPRGNLIIGGQVFNVDAPVVNWHENGWDATSELCISTKTEAAPACAPAGPGKQFPYGHMPVPYTQRYSTRPTLRTEKWNRGLNPSYEAVKATIKQFVVHHDGCTSADMCFNVVQNERGLSVHFLLDNDGTIYQTIDLGLMAYHAADWNLYSIGVELCNKGDALTYPTTYDGGRFGPKRDVRTIKINNSTIKAFDYTPAQMDSFRRLCRELLKLFPNLPAEYPQSSPGEQLWNTFGNPNTERERYAGYLGHYHITQQKWDPGPFDFKDFCGKLRGAFCFPMFPKIDPGKNEDKPVLPDDGGELKDQANKLFALNETRADGGFFPVGPWGENRLWHGGIHIIGKAGGGVFAPYPGRLVAARMGKDSAIGSFNFVLLRHDMTLGPTKIQFYSLYMHLANEREHAAPVEWTTKDGWKDGVRKAQANGVVLLDEPIEAGALIGHVGKVGPDDLARPQVHVEFFSESFIDLPGSNWRLVDGTSGGRFCEAPEINDLIDKNRDGVLSRQELADFFSTGGGEQLHTMVTLHVSEWTPEPSWAEALSVPKDFRDKKKADIEAMVAEQITPGLWWTTAVATHCRLPQDGVVYHYHPITFISWVKSQLIETDTMIKKGGGHTVDERDAKVVPKTITDDLGDVLGTSMRSTADITEDPCNKNLTLEQMVQGFDAPECGQ